MIVMREVPELCAVSVCQLVEYFGCGHVLAWDTVYSSGVEAEHPPFFS